MKRKRRRVCLGKNDEATKKKEFIINSTLNYEGAIDMVKRGETESLKPFMSRGQRKRFKKYEEKLEQDELIKKIKSDFNVSASQIVDGEVDVFGDSDPLFLDMREIEDVVKNFNEKKHVKKTKMTNSRRRKIREMERDHFKKILEHKPYMEDPEGTIDEHLKNRIEMENDVNRPLQEKPVVHGDIAPVKKMKKKKKKAPKKNKGKKKITGKKRKRR